VVSNVLAKVKGVLKDPDLLNKQDEKGNTALHLAVNSGNMKILRILLKHKPRLDVLNSAGLTAVHTGVLKNRLDLVPLLLQAGASVHQPDHHLASPYTQL